VHSGHSKKEVISEIFRTVHTFKGDFGHLGMYNTGNNLHILENTIAKMLEEIENFSVNDLQRFIRDIDYNSIMDKDLYIISDVLGEDYLKAKENIQVSLEKIDALEAKVKNMFEEQQAKELVFMIEQLKYSNIKEILYAYNDYVKNMAQRFEKEIADMVITGEDIFIDKNKYSKTFKSFVHIFRNCIDHGIELPESRLNKGKPEFGTISCNLQNYKDSFEISIRDDGNGINIEKIIQKAVQKGILQSDSNDISYEKAVELLFTDEFSTKDTVSTLSGRGIGLSALKAEVTNLSGGVNINSEPDKYTEFVITLPLL
jgi:two-component system chemotaxis sensor kinase CheA